MGKRVKNKQRRQLTVHALDIDAAAEQVRGHEDAGVELLEGLVLRDALLLLLSGVDADGREVALGQEAVELVGAGHLRHEDDNLRFHKTKDR